MKKGAQAPFFCKYSCDFAFFLIILNFSAINKNIL